jgi:SAM-dependent methyltransferase
MQSRRTSDEEYTRRLLTKSSVWWKKIIDVQAPYRWNLRRLRPGFMLDIGCGIGRNLLAVDGIGIDHNPASVQTCRSRGLRAYVQDEFLGSEWARSATFDSLLLAHVAEHMDQNSAIELLRTYIPFLKADGALIMITPQERGFRADPTHVEFVDFESAVTIQRSVGFEPVSSASFPFPRFAGKVFTYNEFVVVGRRSTA